MYYNTIADLKNMDVVILAAGRGSRMGQYTHQINKVMLPITTTTQSTQSTQSTKTPILLETIKACKTNNLDNFIIVVGYQSQSIKNYFGNGEHHNIKINYINQKDIKGGTADAVKVAQSLVNTNQFLLVYGDIIPTANNIANLISISPNISCMGVRRVEDPTRFGVVETTNNNKIINIVEKSPNPPSNLINAGVYVLQNPIIFKYIEKTKKSARGEYELTDSIQMFIDGGGTMSAMSIHDGVKDIGTLLEYEKIIKIKVSIKQNNVQSQHCNLKSQHCNSVVAKI